MGLRGNFRKIISLYLSNTICPLKMIDDDIVGSSHCSSHPPALPRPHFLGGYPTTQYFLLLLLLEHKPVILLPIPASCQIASTFCRLAECSEVFGDFDAIKKVPPGDVEKSCS